MRNNGIAIEKSTAAGSKWRCVERGRIARKFSRNNREQHIHCDVCSLISAIRSCCKGWWLQAIVSCARRSIEFCVHRFLHAGNVSCYCAIIFSLLWCTQNSCFSFIHYSFHYLPRAHTQKIRITLLPWNFFIQAEEYWQYKFRNLSSNDTSVLTPRQIEFQPDIAICSSIPTTIFLVLNAFFSHKWVMRWLMIYYVVDKGLDTWSFSLMVQN